MYEDSSAPRDGRADVQTQSDARGSLLAAVSRAMVRIHREQFGRGPTGAQSHFAGPNMLVCALSGALLPAELRMIELGLEEQVRASRISFQAATADELVAAVEQILLREVTSFVSAVDPKTGMVFEVFYLAKGENGES